MHRLVIVDYVVMVGFFAVITGIAVWFTRKQTTTERYFVGSRSIPWWAMGVSLMASLFSSVTFVAYPGAAYKSNWAGLVPGLMAPLVLLLMAALVIPYYRQAAGMSAYEYFEKRFGYGARVYASISFLLIQFSKMSMVLYLLSLALSSMAGWNIYMTLVTIEAVTILYVIIGGIEAVIWTSVLQGIALMARGLSCLAVLLFRPEGGPAAVLDLAWRNDKFSMGDLKFDLTQPTFLVLALYGVVVYVQKYATDQAIVQRYLVAKTNRDALRGALLGALLCIPVWVLFLLIGTCVWSYYQITGIPIDPDLRADQVFPMFIVQELPVGLTGLVLAALIATAIDADLNSLSLVIVEDYYRRLRPESTDRHRLFVGKLIVICSGAVTIAVAALLARSGGTALRTVFHIASIVSGGVTGLFALAFLCPRATAGGAYLGIVASVAFTAWAAVTSTWNAAATAAKSAGAAADMAAAAAIARAEAWSGWMYTLDSLLIGVFAAALLFAIGYVTSPMFGKLASSTSLTLQGWLRNRDCSFSERLIASDLGVIACHTKSTAE